MADRSRTISQQSRPAPSSRLQGSTGTPSQACARGAAPDDQPLAWLASPSRAAEVGAGCRPTASGNVVAQAEAEGEVPAQGLGSLGHVPGLPEDRGP